MIERFYKAVLRQDEEGIRQCFRDDALVNWPCTNERFTVKAFILANCEYPGKWDGEIERVENAGDTAIAVVRVYAKDRALSFHVVSFIRIQDGKIASLDEYWADDGAPPQWRQALNIASPIR